MPATCGMPLIKVGVFVGIIYLIHSIICSTYTIIKLCEYMQEKKKAQAEGFPFTEDKEATSGLATLLSLGLTCIMTSILLIWGSIRRNYLFLTPWLFYAAIMIFVTGLYLFALVYKLIVYSTTANSHTTIEGSAMKMLILSLALVLQIVIYKTIKSLQNELIFERQLSRFESGSTIYIIQHEEPTDQR